MSLDSRGEVEGEGAEETFAYYLKACGYGESSSFPDHLRVPARTLFEMGLPLEEYRRLLNKLTEITPEQLTPDLLGGIYELGRESVKTVRGHQSFTTNNIAKLLY